MRIISIGIPPAAEVEIRGLLAATYPSWWLHTCGTQEEFRAALGGEVPDLIVAGYLDEELTPAGAFGIAFRHVPQAAFIGLTAGPSHPSARDLVMQGALDAFPLDSLWRLPLALARLEAEKRCKAAQRESGSMAVLLEAVRRLSLARRMDQIVEVVRHAARELSQADGATFVLRDGDFCHYVEEDAIGPLWRGCRFPMANCISGWAMMNRQAAVVPDIYADPRIPLDAYRPTFVKSLVMMPIRCEDPIGAIGTYWARQRSVTGRELELIQALADSTALAIENVQFLGDLERRVQERTASLEGANRELEAFSSSVSHDLRSPLQVILGYADLLLESSHPRLPDPEKEMIRDMRISARRMQILIEDLLRLSRVTRREVERAPVDLDRMAEDILATLAASDPGRRVEPRIRKGLATVGDPGLLRIALENLLSNAWKYTSTRPLAVIEIGSAGKSGESQVFFVRDNGVGFEMEKAKRLFEPFQRLHTTTEFPGTGIGLATVQRILQKHGGRAWAESAKDRGTTLYFSLPHDPKSLEQSRAEAVAPALAAVPAAG